MIKIKKRFLSIFLITNFLIISIKAMEINFKKEILELQNLKPKIENEVKIKEKIKLLNLILQKIDEPKHKNNFNRVIQNLLGVLLDIYDIKFDNIKNKNIKDTKNYTEYILSANTAIYDYKCISEEIIKYYETKVNILEKIINSNLDINQSKNFNNKFNKKKIKLNQHKMILKKRLEKQLEYLNLCKISSANIEFSLNDKNNVDYHILKLREIIDENKSIHIDSALKSLCWQLLENNPNEMNFKTAIDYLESALKKANAKNLDWIKTYLGYAYYEYGKILIDKNKHERAFPIFKSGTKIQNINCAYNYLKLLNYKIDNYNIKEIEKQIKLIEYVISQNKKNSNIKVDSILFNPKLSKSELSELKRIKDDILEKKAILNSLDKDNLNNLIEARNYLANKNNNKNNYNHIINDIYYKILTNENHLKNLNENDVIKYFIDYIKINSSLFKTCNLNSVYDVILDYILKTNKTKRLELIKQLETEQKEILNINLIEKLLSQSYFVAGKKLAEIKIKSLLNEFILKKKNYIEPLNCDTDYIDKDELENINKNDLLQNLDTSIKLFLMQSNNIEIKESLFENLKKYISFEPEIRIYHKIIATKKNYLKEKNEIRKKIIKINFKNLVKYLDSENILTKEKIKKLQHELFKNPQNLKQFVEGITYSLENYSEQYKIIPKIKYDTSEEKEIEDFLLKLGKVQSNEN